MAQTAKKLFVEPGSEAPASPPVSAVSADGAATGEGDGPAQALQAYLRDALVEDAPREGRWTPGQTLRFVAVGSGLLWAVLVGGLAILS